jgi:CheY-like chemotaxis protein
MQAAQRGATLAKRMLAFARRQELETTSVDLRDLVESMREMLDRSLGASATLVLETSWVPAVRADAGQVEMALLNLALNARDAMPNGGSIAITTRPTVFAEENGLGLKPGPYVGLSVRDEGMGMSAETLSRAAEPFFTTKGTGKGTGLGLAMVHGLAEQLDGKLKLESALGRGKTATLWLPVVREDADIKASPEQHKHQSGQKLRILAVDDDALVLLNTVMLLEEHGHTVRSAYSGKEALEIVQSTEIDLVVTDQGMPGMTGLELIEAARRIRPGLPGLVATGYAELPATTPKQQTRLSKPFLGQQLLDAVEEAMAAMS